MQLKAFLCKAYYFLISGIFQCGTNVRLLLLLSLLLFYSYYFSDYYNHINYYYNSYVYYFFIFNIILLFFYFSCVAPRCDWPMQSYHACDDQIKG